jgi:glutathione S-transferase
VLRWILWDNHKLTSYSATYRFMRIFAGKGDTPEAQFFRARAESAWKVLDRTSPDRDFVAADRPTIADLSLCGYLFWPAQIGMITETNIRTYRSGWTASATCPASSCRKT